VDGAGKGGVSMNSSAGRTWLQRNRVMDNPKFALCCVLSYRETRTSYKGDLGLLIRGISIV
jgi:hypothetical protein